jgi:NAD+ synthase (glutamine-hydrolysing)
MSRLRLALAQVNAVVGDLDGNVDRVVRALDEAARSDADLVVFPELVLCGYPPEDLLLRPAFVDGVAAALHRTAEATSAHPGLVAVIGFVERDGDRLHNAAAVCAEGRVRGVYRKRLLPNYAVFDEERYFEPGGESPLLWGVAGVSVGVAICEDAWADDGPLSRLADGGAEVVVLLNASPFHAGKRLEREHTVARRAVEAGCAHVYVNLVGGQDELVFDGGSFVVDPSGQVVHRSPSFVDEVAVVDLDVAAAPTPEVGLPVVEITTCTAAASQPLRVPHAAPLLSEVEEVYAALVVGTRDYVRKNGFTDVVLGLSGGIDSSLVATIAADAVGSDRVHGVALPSRYSSAHSLADADDLATRLGIDMRTIPIEAGHAALLDMLSPSFATDGVDIDDAELGLTGENLQSRIRAVAIMALSNRFGWLVLTTSNKSESAVGYSTLYGDSAGGLAVIKDVPKLLVYRLCRHRNELAAADGKVPPIPVSVLDKPPSAELRPGQRDDQSLPPYEILDPLLEAYVEGDRSAAELVADGHDPALVARVVRLVDGAEYKRRQSPPGLRVTTKAFGKDRRLPITNAYRG